MNTKFHDNQAFTRVFIVYRNLIGPWQSNFRILNLEMISGGQITNHRNNLVRGETGKLQVEI